MRTAVSAEESRRVVFLISCLYTYLVTYMLRCIRQYLQTRHLSLKVHFTCVLLWSAGVLSKKARNLYFLHKDITFQVWIPPWRLLSFHPQNWKIKRECSRTRHHGLRARLPCLQACIRRHVYGHLNLSTDVFLSLSIWEAHLHLSTHVSLSLYVKRTSLRFYVSLYLPLFLYLEGTSMYLCIFLSSSV